MKQTRNTQQKRLIMELIEQNKNHPTADELYELARLREPRISRGTVYRNLNALAQAGELRRLSMPYGPDHFDCGLHDHYHFLCRSCNHIADVPLPYMEELNAATPGLSGYRTQWHELVLVGLCPACEEA